MEKFGLIGYPLGHSMSPVIHRELFKINGIDASYELMQIHPDDLADGIGTLINFKGFNVTIPHKTQIISFLDKLSDRAELFGSVNTVFNDNGTKIGYNTDCFGFLRAMEMAGIKLGGNVLLCGSGGVSRMFAFESVMAGASLTLAVRDSDIPAAENIAQEIRQKLERDVTVKNLDSIDGDYDILINGTPVGMFPKSDACVLSKKQVQRCSAVFDAVYNPLETLLVSYAKDAGAKYSNGLPMLVWQAAVAQEIWLGVKFTDEQIKAVIDITERELKK